MLLLRLLIIGLLLLVLIQDLRYRAVAWLAFPAITICFCADKLYIGVGYSELFLSTSLNICFLFTLFLFVWFYFSLKYRRLVYLPDKLIGWGDLLFLLAVGFYLSLLNFILFYIISLIVVLIGWLLYKTICKNKSEQIPLAGLQSAVLIVFLMCDWCLKIFSLGNDEWLLSYLIK